MSKSKGNVDLLMYRMDLLEKRLDHLESMLHKSGNNPSSEIMHFLLDMVKQQTGLMSNQRGPVEPVATEIHTHNHDEKEKPLRTVPGDSLDAVSCLGRRRTVV